MPKRQVKDSYFEELLDVPRSTSSTSPHTVSAAPNKRRRARNTLPALIPPMHEDIQAELTRIPFAPQKITHDSAPEDEMNSSAELLHAVACQLQDKLRHPDLCVDSVAKLTNGTVRFLKARRELLNFQRSHDPDGAIPIKPPVRPIG